MYLVLKIIYYNLSLIRYRLATSSTYCGNDCCWPRARLSDSDLGANMAEEHAPSRVLRDCAESILRCIQTMEGDSKSENA